MQDAQAQDEHLLLVAPGGPNCPRMFHRDQSRALDSLTALEELDADALLPRPWAGHPHSVGATVEHAREPASQDGPAARLHG
ncbi:hypothetical protein ACWD5Q_29015 [Streptomyces sp. NPDC002513]